jgi:hypothetical protein
MWYRSARVSNPGLMEESLVDLWVVMGSNPGWVTTVGVFIACDLPFPMTWEHACTDEKSTHWLS